MDQLEYVFEDGYVSTNPKAAVRKIRYVVDESGCWICVSHTRSKNRGNYPVLRRFDRHTRMSRYVFEVANGFIEEDKFVMHSCDTPECINPSHLSLGTPKENSEDMVRKRRNKTGEHHPFSKLTTEDVLSIYVNTGSCLALADDYGVSKKTILNVRHRKTWKKELDTAFPGDRRWSRELK